MLSEPTISCVRNQHSTLMLTFKLMPFHASVLFQILWLRWIQWISVPFRKNSTIVQRTIVFLFHSQKYFVDSIICRQEIQYNTRVSHYE